MLHICLYEFGHLSEFGGNRVKQYDIKGKPLASALTAHMNKDGASITAVARHLGISQSYLSQLLAGDKSFSAVDDSLLRSVASYLSIPPVIGFLLAERLQHSDFIEPNVEFETKLNAALQIIATSPYALEAAVNAEELMSLSQPTKLLMVLLFQATTGRELIPGKCWPWMPGVLP